MKKSLMGFALLCAATFAHAQPDQVDAEQAKLKQAALTAAVADSVTTHIALQAGGVEGNPLVNASPIGLVGLAALKWGLVELVNASDMPAQQKKATYKGVTALWGGAAANNLLIAASAAGPVALLGGIAAGTFLWFYDFTPSITPTE